MVSYLVEQGRTGRTHKGESGYLGAQAQRKL
jgi:hypothetical protein